MSDLTIPLLDPSEPVICHGCGWEGRWQDADLTVRDFCARIDLLGRPPVGECPECHKLISFTRTDDSLVDYGLSTTARKILPLFYELHQNLLDLREKGLLSAETIGEHWPELSARMDKITIQQHEALVDELKRILSEES